MRRKRQLAGNLMVIDMLVQFCRPLAISEPINSTPSDFLRDFIDLVWKF